MGKHAFHILLGLLLLLAACAERPEEAERILPDLPIDSLLALSEAKFATAPDSAYLYARKAYNMATEEEMPYALAQSRLLMGKAYYQQGRFNAATQALLEAYEGFEALESWAEMAETGNLLGRVYQQTEQFPLALQYYNTALDLSQRAGNQPLTAQTFGNLGHLYEKQQMYDSALLYQYKARNLLLEIGDSAEIATIYDNIGSIYEDLGQYDQAFPYFWQAYQCSRRSGNLNESIVNLNNLGDVYRKRGIYDSALVYSLMALEEAQSSNNHYQLRSSYRDLAKLYRDMGDFETAHRYQEIAYDLNGEIYSEQLAAELAGTRAVYELEEKEQRIQLLEKDQRLEKVYRNALTTIALLIVVIGALVFWQQKQRINKNKKLTEAELLNSQLNEQNLKTELENKKLREEQLHKELEIKSRSLTKNALHVIQKNEFLETLKSELKAIRKGDKDEIVKKVRHLEKSIDLNFNLDDDWQEFEAVFQQVHADFFHQLQQQYPDLTPTELRLCAMIRLNLNSKDISTIMGISQDSLRISRYRLRKKLNLDKGSNLYSFIMHIG